MKSFYTSLLLSAVLFISFLSVSGCTKQAASIMPSSDSLSRSYLALGDSYTIGESVSDAERFPAQTVSLLRSKGIRISEPSYVARTGWTTIDLSNAIAQSTLLGKYDVVSLLIGVNDQYQGLDTGGYRIHFTQLLQKSISLAGDRADHVFVLSIPDYSATPFGGGSAKIKKELEYFNNINSEVTLAWHISYTDIVSISRDAAADRSLVASDGLHPSAKQYQRWALLLADAMLPVLK